MKTILYLLLALFIAIGVSYPQSISITNPTEGSEVQKGRVLSITWTATDITNGFKITLWKNDVLVKVIESNVAPGNGTRRLNWLVDVDSGDRYQIKIKEKRAPVSDISGYFRIVDGAIRVSSPRNGDEKIKGHNMRIRWQSSGLSGTTKIYLLKNNRKIGTITTCDSSVREYNWNSKSVIEPVKTMAGSDYSIKVCNGDESVCGRSEGNFTLIYPPGVWVFQPREGVTWDINTIKKIKWNATNVDGRTLDISVSWTRDGERFGYRIAEAVPATQKEYSWKVGEYIRGDIPTDALLFGVNSGCYIQIGSNDGGTRVHSRSKLFNIKRPTIIRYKRVKKK